MKKKEIEYTKIFEEFDQVIKDNLLTMYVKEIRDNYDIEDIVRKRDGQWIVVLKYNSFKKFLDDPIK